MANLTTINHMAEEDAGRARTFTYTTTLHSYIEKLSYYKSAREKFIQDVISTGFENCYLEFPCLELATKKGSTPQAEFTVIESKPFHRADSHSFESHFLRNIGQSVCVFPNRTNDTTLVVPVPKYDDNIDVHSGHLMDFLKNGDRDQVNAVIQRAADDALMMCDKGMKVYISTHGHGIPWLHFRLSSVPKYYHHKPYTNQKISKV